LSYTDVNAAVSLHLVLMMQAFLFVIQVESIMFSEKFPTQSQCHQCAPKIGHIFGMFLRGLEREPIAQNHFTEPQIAGQIYTKKKNSQSKLYLVYKPIKTHVVPTEYTW
jgi:hypothetical protein